MLWKKESSLDFSAFAELLLRAIRRTEVKMSQEFDALATSVTTLNTNVDTLLTSFASLTEQIKNVIPDLTPAQLTALQAVVDQETSKVTAALNPPPPVSTIPTS